MSESFAKVAVNFIEQLVHFNGVQLLKLSVLINKLLSRFERHPTCPSASRIEMVDLLFSGISLVSAFLRTPVPKGNY